MPGLKRLSAILVTATIGFSARLLAIKFVGEVASSRVEVSNPINDWKRAREAVHLWKHGLNPYDGNIFHEYPLSLYFYHLIVTYLNIEYIIAIADTLTALLLLSSCRNQLQATGHDKLRARSIAEKVFAIYLFSPITLLSCAALSTSTFINLIIALTLNTLPIRILQPLTWLLGAILTCCNIHFGSLVLPIFLCGQYYSTGSNLLQSTDAKAKPYYSSKRFQTSLCSFLSLYVLSVAGLMVTSYFIMDGSWTFINTVYIFILKVNDLKPNIGMLWYFFTEMFDHFLDFFISVIQINAFIHIIPTSIYLRDKPFFLVYLTILTSTIFQPYPSMSSLGLITSLIPCWSGLFSHMKHGLIITSAMLTCMTLLPIFWHLWIVLGTANANFYFGATMALTSSFILLTTSLLNADVISSAKVKLEEYKKQHQIIDKLKSSPTQ